ncbi:MAG TPA: TauD/TfdA family dioxygenase [Pyrinomonadaceae bacterium]|jgi:alpha-ketoglutarate-dependent taurine dioxygenase
MFVKNFDNSQKLPLIIEPSSKSAKTDVSTEIIEAREFFNAELLAHGALLFRGFDIESIEEFENFARSFAEKDLLDYAGGVSPRVSMSKGVYTSTEYPPHLTLSLHNELSYSANYPQRLYFFCAVAPEIGGETTVGDSRRILQSVDSKIVDLFKSKNIRYDRNLSGEAGTGYSWQDAFETADRQAVENHCRKIGAEYEWKPDGGLRVSQTRPATTVHPQTGEEIWFNQADGFHPSNLDNETYELMKGNFRLDAFFGDGSPLEISMLEHVREVLRAETVPVKWQQGDILIVDNLLSAHGRMPFSGARKIVLAMS